MEVTFEKRVGRGPGWPWKVKVEIKYSSKFSEESLFNYIKKVVNKGGKGCIPKTSTLLDNWAAVKFLELYYRFSTAENIEKLVIVAVLGYFIMPFDARPDFMPGGWVDDLAYLREALQFVKRVPPSNGLARKKLKELKSE